MKIAFAETVHYTLFKNKITELKFLNYIEHVRIIQGNGLVDR